MSIQIADNAMNILKIQASIYIIELMFRLIWHFNFSIGLGKPG